MLTEQVNAIGNFPQTIVQIGSGILYKAVATLGATVSAQVDFTVQGCTYEEAIALTKEWAIETGREQEFAKALKEKDLSGKAGCSFFFGFINLAAGGTYADGAEQKAIKITNSDSQLAKDLIDHLFKQSHRTLRCHGTMQLSGISTDPIMCHLVVEIMGITRKGTTMKIVNNEGLKVISSKGETVGKTNSKLHVKPFK